MKLLNLLNAVTFPDVIFYASEVCRLLPCSDVSCINCPLVSQPADLIQTHIVEKMAHEVRDPATD